MDIRFPVEIRDASLAAATFLVPAGPVRDVVEPTGLRVVTAPGGRAPVILTLVDYRDTDLGAYHEVGLCFLVRSPSGGRGGALVHELPVNQAFTLQAGRQLWGFPKWMADIDLEFGSRAATCHLAEGSEHILTLALRPAPFRVPGGRELTMDAWTYQDGVVRRTPWTMRHEQVRMRPGGASLVVGDGHSMAKELRTLGLPRRAVFTTVVGRVTGRFDAATVQN